MQIPPSPHLSHIVKHYLVLESDFGGQLNYRLFSDGNPGMVFYFKSPMIERTAGRIYTHSHSFLYGQITEYKDLISTGELGILVIVLQPYGINALLDMASVELNDCRVKLSEIFKTDGADLEDRVLNAIDINSKIECVENFVFKKLANVQCPDKTLTAALKLIDNHRGNIAISGLLNVLPITEKQLERRFKEYIGVSPKRFSAIVKLHYFLKSLQSHSPDTKIADVAYESGYYDQAHLNNHFKKNIGITPSAYKTNNLLAINFMQV